MLALPAAGRLCRLPPEVRAILADLLVELSADARSRAEMNWRKNKAPMAAYWRAVSTYSNHLRRIIR